MRDAKRAWGLLCVLFMTGCGYLDTDIALTDELFELSFQCHGSQGFGTLGTRGHSCTHCRNRHGRVEYTGASGVQMVPGVTMTGGAAGVAVPQSGIVGAVGGEGSVGPRSLTETGDVDQQGDSEHARVTPGTVEAVYYETLAARRESVQAFQRSETVEPAR